MRVDLTVLAIPAYVGAMGAEIWWWRKHPAEPGTRAGDYEFHDTVASLSMGLGSLIAPFVAKKLLDPITPGVGRWGKALLGVAAATSAATTVADVARRRYAEGGLPAAGTVPQRAASEGVGTPQRNRLTKSVAAAAVGSTALSVATTWAAATGGQKLFGKTSRDLGTGRAAVVAGILGWDFIYYWNHRLSHESRWMWAMHVAHHSSEHYNLSTALRQPVAEGITLSVPYGLLALAGVRPQVIEDARALNLIYQVWIHTEAIRSIGWLENVLNTPSHHRVHHGSYRRYLDRNHGSILILWDRLFGTFERESEPVIYGLTRNINTYNPVRIATHEWRDMFRDIAGSDNWRDRWSFLVLGPGWAYERRGQIAAI